MTVSDVISTCLNVSYYDTTVSIHRPDRTIKFKNYSHVPLEIRNQAIKTFFVSYKYQTGICSGIDFYVDKED